MDALSHSERDITTTPSAMPPHIGTKAATLGFDERGVTSDWQASSAATIPSAFSSDETVVFSEHGEVEFKIMPDLSQGTICEDGAHSI